MKFYVYITEPLATGLFRVKMCHCPLTKVEADRWVASNCKHDFTSPYNDKSRIMYDYTRNLMMVDRWEYILTFFIKLPNQILEFECLDAVIPLGKYNFDYTKAIATSPNAKIVNFFRLAWPVIHVLADLDFKS